MAWKALCHKAFRVFGPGTNLAHLPCEQVMHLFSGRFDFLRLGVDIVVHRHADSRVPCDGLQGFRIGAHTGKISQIAVPRYMSVQVLPAWIVALRAGQQVYRVSHHRGNPE